MALIPVPSTSKAREHVTPWPGYFPGMYVLTDACVTIVGAGRLGKALANAMKGAELHVSGPLGRGADGSGADIVLLCVPDAAERLGAVAGVERTLFVPLVRAAVENWARLGGRRALTGPIVRGDAATAARQRDAVAARTPELLPLWDALTEATRALARGQGS